MGYLFANKSREEMTLRDAIDEVQDSMKEMDLTTQQALAVVMKHVRETPEDCVLKHVTNMCSYDKTGCSDCEAKIMVRNLMKNAEEEHISNMTAFQLKEAVEGFGDERGWINETQFCVWVKYEYVNQFMTSLRDLFGNGIFDDGGFSANMQSDGICIDLCEALEGYGFPLEDVFPKDKYQH